MLNDTIRDQSHAAQDDSSYTTLSHSAREFIGHFEGGKADLVVCDGAGVWTLLDCTTWMSMSGLSYCWL